MIIIGPISDKYMTYNDAIMYCLFFEHDGKKGWRLPTYEEYTHSFGLATLIWFQNEDENDNNTEWKVQPVRDIAEAHNGKKQAGDDNE